MVKICSLKEYNKNLKNYSIKGYMRLLRNSGNQICIAAESLYPIIDENFIPSDSALSIKSNALKNTPTLGPVETIIFATFYFFKN